MGKSLKQRGFTIVELIVVVLVIGVLVVLATVSYNGIQQNARDKALLSDIDAVESEVARYAVKNAGKYGSAVQWTSTGASNANIRFFPSQNNVIDVVATDSLYCIRAFNPASNKKTIETAASKGSSPEACDLISGSTAAGGSGGKVVGWWKLNGDAIDSSGEGRDGTVTGATPTTGQNGTTNGAYAFSQTATQFINTNYTFPLDKLSVSMWVKWSGASVASYATLISNTRDCCSTYNGIQMHIQKSGSALGTRLWYGAASSSMAYSSIPLNQWTHVALTYDGAMSALYVNGAQVKTAALTEPLGVPAINVFIGRGGWSNGYGFGGDIDDVRIYNYGMSAETVKSIFDKGAL